MSLRSAEMIPFLALTTTPAQLSLAPAACQTPGGAPDFALALCAADLALCAADLATAPAGHEAVTAPLHDPPAANWLAATRATVHAQTDLSAPVPEASGNADEAPASAGQSAPVTDKDLPPCPAVDPAPTSLLALLGGLPMQSEPAPPLVVGTAEGTEACRIPAASSGVAPTSPASSSRPAPTRTGAAELALQSSGIRPSIVPAGPQAQAASPSLAEALAPEVRRDPSPPRGLARPGDTLASTAPPAPPAPPISHADEARPARVVLGDPAIQSIGSLAPMAEPGTGSAWDPGAPMPSAAAAAPPHAAAGAGTHAAAQTQVSARLDSAAFAPELGARICTFARQGVEHARIDLHPAEMGPVTVQILVEGTTAQVRLWAELAPTRQALEQAMPNLASQLRDNGLTLTGGGVFEQARQAPDQGRDDAGAGARREPPAHADRRPPVLALASRRRGIVDLVA